VFFPFLTCTYLPLRFTWVGDRCMLRMGKTLLPGKMCDWKADPFVSYTLSCMNGVRDKCISVFCVLNRNGHLNFNRWLPPILFEIWMEVLEENFSFHFVHLNDTMSWKWSSKMFTTKSVYDHLTLGPWGGHFYHIWKAKIPYKIKILTWLVEQGAVLTKDNMVKRKC